MWPDLLAIADIFLALLIFGIYADKFARMKGAPWRWFYFLGALAGFGWLIMYSMIVLGLDVPREYARIIITFTLTLQAAWGIRSRC